MNYTLQLKSLIGKGIKIMKKIIALFLTGLMALMPITASANVDTNVWYFV